MLVTVINEVEFYFHLYWLCRLLRVLQIHSLLLVQEFAAFLAARCGRVAKFGSNGYKQKWPVALLHPSLKTTESPSPSPPRRLHTTAQACCSPGPRRQAQHWTYTKMVPQPNGRNSGLQMTNGEEWCPAKLAPRTSRLLQEIDFDHIYATEFLWSLCCSSLACILINTKKSKELEVSNKTRTRGTGLANGQRDVESQQPLSWHHLVFGKYQILTDIWLNSW